MTANDESITIPKARLDQLVRMTTITYVDGKRIPAARVLAWVEANLVRLGAAPCMAEDGHLSSEEFAELDVHDLARLNAERMREGMGK